ncbi:MAG: VWA domain-containing protein [Alphaproteobacteria bacterium]|nr:VWA domain-containing protein [Alphaproteobacteria bacterium]
MTQAPAAAEESGRLHENIMHFGRVLRAAGLPVGPGTVIEAIRAVQAVGIGSRDDFYWTLHAVFVNRRDHREIFDQAFHIFWRNPKILERVMSVLLPSFGADADGVSEAKQASRRLADAFFPGAGGDQRQQEDDRPLFDAAFTYSANEDLKRIDFESMSAEEIRQAKAVIARLRLPIMDVPTRRFTANQRGPRVDLRATIRTSLRSGGNLILLRRKLRRRRHPPLVVLCDISGSMSRYSRMFLHFMHAITNDRDRVFTFVFGTRLTNITRYLRAKDVDLSLTAVSDAVADWSGGTRIGRCLHDFNSNWSRRVLSQGALVVLISDGLDRDPAQGLAFEMERLHKSCRRLIWLNPLLRFDQYEAKAAGAKAMLPHVDEFRAIHNLESMADLAATLGQPGVRREKAGALEQMGQVA